MKGRFLAWGLLAIAAAGCATGGTAGDDDPGGGVDAGPVSDGGLVDRVITGDRTLPPIDGAVPPIDGAVPIDAAPTGCAATTTCTGVTTSLGNISGDTGAQTLSTMGSTSHWIRVRATEDYDGIDAISMTFRATLTSPPGANFDLYLYVNTSTDVRECATPTGSATTSGSDVVNLLWGETGIVANGSNDDRDVMIEVRHVSGTCAAGQQWTLTMIGNQ